MTEVNSFAMDELIKLTKELKRRITNPVFLCLGTEKVFADSLGPRVGTLLNEHLQLPYFVYGMQHKNVTAENLLNGYKFVKALHPSSQVVVIDSAVGSKEQIGKVQLCNGGIVPGSATNKNLPCIGDVSVIGIVAERGMADFYTLSSQKEQLVNKVAQFIATGICNACAEN